MEDIEMKKDVLIDKIKANLETHTDTYEKAVEVFKRKQVALLEEMLEKAKHGGEFDRLALSRMPLLENHTNDYELALEMLELETRDVVSIDTYAFRRYVRDEWEWKQSWAANTQAYSLGH